MSWGLPGIAPLLVVSFGGLLLMIAEAFSKHREESDGRKSGPSSELALATAVTLFAGAVFSAAVWFVGFGSANRFRWGRMTILGRFLDLLGPGIALSLGPLAGGAPFAEVLLVLLRPVAFEVAQPFGHLIERR